MAYVEVVDPGQIYYPGTGVIVRAGDVLITNDTTSSGLTGHAGIVTDELTVDTFDGPGLNPKRQNFCEWMNKHATNGPWTKVVRYVVLWQPKWPEVLQAFSTLPPCAASLLFPIKDGDLRPVAEGQFGENLRDVVLDRAFA